MTQSGASVRTASAYAQLMCYKGAVAGEKIPEDGVNDHQNMLRARICE